MTLERTEEDSDPQVAPNVPVTERERLAALHHEGGWLPGGCTLESHGFGKPEHVITWSFCPNADIHRHFAEWMVERGVHFAPAPLLRGDLADMREIAEEAVEGGYDHAAIRPERILALLNRQKPPPPSPDLRAAEDALRAEVEKEARRHGQYEGTHAGLGLSQSANEHRAARLAYEHVLAFIDNAAPQDAAEPRNG